jgi:phospholipid-binding lipoprotein MlaA
MTSGPVRRRRAAAAGLLVLAAALAGCASVPAAAEGGVARAPVLLAPSPADPLERWNRGVFAFNEALDAAVIAPLARGYRAVVPAPLRTAVGNFFGNLRDAWSGVNQLLQAKPLDAVHMGMRFSVNTVFGVVGLVDVASEVGLDRRSEDFGQTLGRWGVPAGPYLVLPLFGPSTLRDSFGLLADSAAAPVMWLGHEHERWAATALDLVHRRSVLVGADQLLRDIAFDRYQFIRDAHLQRRHNLVHDGNPPAGEDDFDYDEDWNAGADAPAAAPPVAVPSTPR